jgi:hypothetical protein
VVSRTVDPSLVLLVLLVLLMLLLAESRSWQVSAPAARPTSCTAPSPQTSQPPAGPSMAATTGRSCAAPTPILRNADGVRVDRHGC